ncbi:MAG: twin-arginine translocase TatA/TatE family subunit [Bacteriovoracaceae bacterium]|jgi:TatA/E family protein of Tat protein translocase|nr:twin-arginine translocase TatA/TatE family subunit [Bacteriovoracaceae bacterium]
MFGLGITEIVAILVIALIFIGPKKLPGLAKGLGKGIREFQNALGGISDQIKNPPKDQIIEEKDESAQKADS